MIPRFPAVCFGHKKTRRGWAGLSCPIKDLCMVAGACKHRYRQSLAFSI